MEALKKEVVMKSIEIDDDLYAFIASQTKHIGESASQILRRLLLPEDGVASNTELSATLALKTEEKNATVETSASDNAEVNSVDEISAASTSEKTVTAAKKGRATVKSPSKVVAKTVAAPSKAVTSSSKTAASVKSEPLELHSRQDILDVVTHNALKAFTKRVDQFLFVLSAAHKLNADNFTNVENIKGKNRTYFATSKAALLENGSSTNPKAIPESPFWVVTNNNTAKKTNMLEQVLRQLGYQPEVVEAVVSRFSSEGK